MTTIQYLKQRPHSVGFDFDLDLLKTLSPKEKLECINDHVQYNFYDFLEVSPSKEPKSFFIVHKNPEPKIEAIISYNETTSSFKLYFINENLGEEEKMQLEVVAEDILLMFFGSRQTLEIPSSVDA